jgi:cyclopropane-fatty-acyl-phospholipid synthase
MPALAEKQVKAYFANAGISVEHANTRNDYFPSADIIIHNKSAYIKFAIKGTSAFAEGIVDGSVTCKHVTKVTYDVISNTKRRTYTPAEIALIVVDKVINRQSPALSQRVMDLHYNITPQLFQHMLGKYMKYTCAFFEEGVNDNNLDEAQRRCMVLLCKKLQLKPGDKVLDIGCGWGELVKFMCEYCPGIEVTGITLAEEQLNEARKKCKGLNATFQLIDYRDLKGVEFDKIVSVGMFEHVGLKNGNVFFDDAYRLLKQDGILVVHSIVGSLKGANEGFLEKYIFPGGQLPPVGFIERCALRPGLFKMHHSHEFGLSYAKTLHAWKVNFLEWWDSLSEKERLSLFCDAFKKRWAKLNLTPNERVERFKRVWLYYLEMCEGVFLARRAFLYQFVFVKPLYNGEPLGRFETAA